MCLCVCVCITANLCNGLLLKIIGQFVQKYTLALVPDSMAEIRQSKVKKTLILSACHICSVMSIMSTRVSDHSVTFIVKLPCNFSPLHLMISLKQWRSAIGCFFPVIGCELNVNARMCNMM